MQATEITVRPIPFAEECWKTLERLQCTQQSCLRISGFFFSSWAKVVFQSSSPSGPSMWSGILYGLFKWCCDALPDSRDMGPDTLPDSRKMRPLTTNVGNWNHSEIDPSCWKLLSTLERQQCTQQSCLRIRVVSIFSLEWWSFNHHHHALLVMQ